MEGGHCAAMNGNGFQFNQMGLVDVQVRFLAPDKAHFGIFYERFPNPADRKEVDDLKKIYGKSGVNK